VVGDQHPVVETDVQVRHTLVGGGGGQPLQRAAQIVAEIADGAAQERRQALYPIHPIAAQQELEESPGVLFRNYPTRRTTKLDAAAPAPYGQKGSAVKNE
jgi:hypothetical protein